MEFCWSAAVGTLHVEGDRVLYGCMRQYPTKVRIVMFTIGLEGHGWLIRDSWFHSPSQCRQANWLLWWPWQFSLWMDIASYLDDVVSQALDCCLSGLYKHVLITGDEFTDEFWCKWNCQKRFPFLTQFQQHVETCKKLLSHIRGSNNIFWHSACSAAKSLGQSALRRTKESASQILSHINHPWLLPNTLNMESTRICR